MKHKGTGTPDEARNKAYNYYNGKPEIVDKSDYELQKGDIKYHTKKEERG